MLFAQNIKEKRNSYGSENQFEDSQLNPIIGKINHLSALQPITQKILDNTKFNTITTTLLKSSAPVKKVTAEIPNNTWEIEIQRLDIYEASLTDSLRTIFLQYQNRKLITRVLKQCVPTVI